MIGNFETVQYEVCLGAKAESHAVSSQETKSNCIHSFREYNVCCLRTICESTGQGQSFTTLQNNKRVTFAFTPLIEPQ